jgi:transcriptional regulator with XRE-family HTH domain
MEKVSKNGNLNNLFGGNVRLIRKTKNNTHTDLSKTSSITVSQLSLIENGKASPTLNTVDKISTALNVEPALLLSKFKMVTSINFEIKKEI